MYRIVVEILEGLEGYFSGQKMEIPGRRRGLHEIPSILGVWIFLELHNIVNIVLILIVLKGQTRLILSVKTCDTHQ